jgi:hypothetical protein
VRRLLLTLAVTASAVVLLGAQRVTQDNLPAHVIVDSCSGCGGSSSGPIAIDQTTPGTTNGVAVTNTPHIVCDSGCGSPPATPDNAAFTASTTSVSITAGVYNDALAALSAGVSAAFRITASRALHVNLRNASGTEISPLTDTQLRASNIGVANLVASGPTDGASANYFNNTSASSGVGTVASYVYNGGLSWDRRRSVANGQDSTGTGIAADGILGQFDDTSTGAVTENNFAPVRISSRRALLVEGVASGTAMPVSGTFWQATQPVSLASVPAHDVTNAGTFAVQAAQSGTWTVQPGNTANTTAWKVDGSAVTQPVSGTFWQATQPISGTVTANAGTNLNTSALALSATQTDRTQKTQITDGTRDGTVKAASTLPAATDTALVVTLRDALSTPVTNANLDVALSTRLKPADTLTGVTTVGTVTTITNAVTVTPPTLTKATQGATGFTTQDLKDAGRTSVMITATVASTATAETLITLTRSVGLASTGTCSSCGITTGKRLRIQAISIAARNSTGTVASNITVNLRAAVGGATSASSPLQMHWMVALPASTVTTLFPTTLIPDGFEIDANGATNTYGITITHPQWVTGTQVATFDLTIVGFEY